MFEDVEVLPKIICETFVNFLEEQLDCDVYPQEVDGNFINFECDHCDCITEEDWIQNFSFRFDDVNDTDKIVDSFIRELDNAYEYFDVDEDVRLWADQAGTNGVPGFSDLVHNAEYKEKKLGEVAKEAHKMRCTWYRKFSD